MTNAQSRPVLLEIEQKPRVWRSARPWPSISATTAVARRLAIEPAQAPHLFRCELRNLLFVAHLRGRIGAADLAEQLALAGIFAIRCSDTDDVEAIVGLPLQHRLTTYDAAYLALARAQRLDLATNDNDLLAAARKERVGIHTSLT